MYGRFYDHSLVLAENRPSCYSPFQTINSNSPPFFFVVIRARTVSLLHSVWSNRNSSLPWRWQDAANCLISLGIMSSMALPAQGCETIHSCCRRPMWLGMYQIKKNYIDYVLAAWLELQGSIERDDDFHASANAVSKRWSNYLNSNGLYWRATHIWKDIADLFEAFIEAIFVDSTMQYLKSSIANTGLHSLTATSFRNSRSQKSRSEARIYRSVLLKIFERDKVNMVW